MNEYKVYITVGNKKPVLVLYFKTYKILANFLLETLKRVIEMQGAIFEVKIK